MSHGFMSQTLRTSFFKTFLLAFCIWCFQISNVFAQSTGDIAFIGYNSDGDDDFSFVVLEDLPAGTDIFFTDEEWDGSAFGTGEDDIIWNTGGSTISKGTVIVFNDITANGTMTVNVGSIVQGSMNLAGSGEILFAYTSSDGNTRNVDTFIAAITNDSGANLTGTGLTQGSTAVFLTSGVDVAEFEGARDGNTKSGYISEINDIASNWTEDNGSGDQSANVLPFDSSSFTITNPPTLAFASSSYSTTEGDGTVDISVELVQSNSVAVDVYVALLGGSSTADASDLNSYTTKKVSFGSSDTDGATKTVTLTITDDSEYEGLEEAVFKLQNNTTGTIVSPSQTTLSINDNDQPDVFITEYLAAPGSDVNGDATNSSTQDEFIEIYNNEIEPVDISSWTLSDDGTTTQYTFPTDTFIPAKGSVVVFGGGDPGTYTGFFGGAVVFSAGSLSLNNSGDSPTLKDDSGSIIDETTYNSSTNDVSDVRQTLDTDAAFELHTTNGSGNYSPGLTKLQALFNEDLHVNGAAGWRMLSAPVDNWALTNLEDDIPLQGIGTDDDLNIYTDYDGSNFVAPTGTSDQLSSGNGFIVYLFNNTQSGSSELPLTIDINSGTEPSSDVSVSLHAAGDKWNLVGNPFKAPIDVTAITVPSGALASSVGQIWDHASGSYITTTTNGDKVLPWQGFFLQNSTATSITIPTSAKTTATDAQLYKSSPTENTYINFVVTGSDGSGQLMDQSTVLYFNDGATNDWDRYDAEKLSSLSWDYVLMNLKGQRDGKIVSKTQDSRPLKLDGSIHIPVEFQTTLTQGQLDVTWEMKGDIPEEWTMIFHDRNTGKQYDLKAVDKITIPVSAAIQQQQKQKGSAAPGTSVTWASNDENAYEIVISPNETTDIDQPGVEGPDEIKLLPNYPNPFNPSTQISYYLPQKSRVKLAVYNVVGQSVAVLENGVVGAGDHSVTWTATDIPSGIYIYQLEVGGEVFTRKMTLIK
jgi:flavodoxin